MHLINPTTATTIQTASISNKKKVKISHQVVRMKNQILKFWKHVNKLRFPRIVGTFTEHKQGPENNGNG